MYREFVAPHLPVSVIIVCTARPVFTVTPDFGFVIDTLPGQDRITIIAACSGHGFKHSPAIGEAVAQTICGESGRVDLGAFRLARQGVMGA